jgi:hypothetical protein
MARPDVSIIASIMVEIDGVQVAVYLTARAIAVAPWRGIAAVRLYLVGSGVPARVADAHLLGGHDSPSMQCVRV